jgi:predicted RNase H-like nuclease (RuvC/YqgF family)
MQYQGGENWILRNGLELSTEQLIDVQDEISEYNKKNIDKIEGIIAVFMDSDDDYNYYKDKCDDLDTEIDDLISINDSKSYDIDKLKSEIVELKKEINVLSNGEISHLKEIIKVYETGIKKINLSLEEI